MTIIRRPATDMFTLVDGANYVVNLVNTKGAMGAGLGKEFRDRFPKMYDRYLLACQENKLHIGHMMLWNDPSVNYGILNLPTKSYYADANDFELIRKALGALQRFLEKKENRYANVVMPMLGGGDAEDYAKIEKMIYDHFDALDAVVTLSCNPDRLGYIPKFLGFSGPRVWAKKQLIGTIPPWRDTPYTEEDYQREYDYVEKAFLDALKLWELTPQDFDAFIAGGATGVDTVACGSSRTDPSFGESLAKKYSKAEPAIIHADWDRYGRAAGMIRNRYMGEIITHAVVIRPDGVTSIGTTGMARWLKTWNEKHPLGTPLYKPTFIAGNADLSARTDHSIMIERNEKVQVLEDAIPY